MKDFDWVYMKLSWLRVEGPKNQKYHDLRQPWTDYSERRTKCGLPISRPWLTETEHRPEGIRFDNARLIAQPCKTCFR